MKKMEFIFRTAGRRLPRLSNTIWIHGSDVESFLSAEQLISVLRARSTVHRILLTSRRFPVCAALKRYFPNDFVLPAPLNRHRTVERFFRRLSPRVIVVLKNEEGLVDLVRDRAARSAVPVIKVDGHPGDIRTLEPLLPPPIRESPPNEGWWFSGLVPRFSRTAAGGVLARLLSSNRIPDLETLRSRLGDPRCILCLGSGPSSEDPRLMDQDYDCLFRSNSQWKGRGVFENPHLVFVGSFETVRRVSGCIFGFRDLETEKVILIGRFFRLKWSPLEYITLETNPMVIDGMRLGARPSSGAFMVILAAALQPEKLVVSGIDLFQHQQGRYPGKANAVNEYAQVHHRDVDVEVIAKALAGYRGELIISSDNLREAIEKNASDNRPVCRPRRALPSLPD